MFASRWINSVAAVALAAGGLALMGCTPETGHHPSSDNGAMDHPAGSPDMSTGNASEGTTQNGVGAGSGSGPAAGATR